MTSNFQKQVKLQKLKTTSSEVVSRNRRILTIQAVHIFYRGDTN